MNDDDLKFCIRCEERLDPEQNRYFKAVQRVIAEMYCEPCYKIVNPFAVKALNGEGSEE